ncbi:hypothetical protein F5148DRAFT_1284822 [Russula earlei]|uniref:Uncharacterized protein n=1 Tax=Russula earlei TaxID=71964 RepID=A0ACC0U803_9AGAM|nr:hypothetical protein F5148DRAFT_1284822 [Russula earlei]
MPSTSSVLRSVFSFRTGSTTVFASLFYLAVFTALITFQSAPSVPAITTQHALGLNLERAYRDLYLITKRPHPYNSRENDAVRNLLLERLQEIAKGYSFIHVDDDVQTNAAFLIGQSAVYFQGTNILVKVDGTHDTTENDAVLFSAHFDSVSTAPGATDDGMSVVALVHLIDFLSKNRPKRTSVFNINNGEEDGLNGAHAFLQHPWSNLTSTFLNFEGAGSGGRPFLFRSTSYDIIKPFRSAPHIHADAISQDAWDQGIIRSDTDYSVYSAPRIHDVSRSHATINATVHGYDGLGGGMQGADVAFYRSRSQYHTMDDSIRGMGDDGTQRSLWALMELLRFVGDTILNTKTTGRPSGENERAVYFELLGLYLVAFRQQVLVVAEIVLLSVGPVVLAGLGYLLLRQSTMSASSPSQIRWHSRFRGYGRFWLALVMGVGAQVGLVVGFLKLNPNTVHGHPIATSLSALTLAYLAMAIPLQLAQRLRPIPPSKQRLIILIQLYALTWLFLVGVTILTLKLNVVGLYWVALWNASLLVAVALGVFEGLWGTGNAGRIILPQGGSEDNEQVQSGERHENEASEATPLLRRASPTLVLEEKIQDRAYFWWIFQFSFSTTAPLLNMVTIYTIWIAAMPQTIPDGDWVGIGAPFHPPNARLKVFFAQKVELTDLSGAISHPQLERAVTQLSVIKGYGQDFVETLPSTWDSSGRRCMDGSLHLGFTTCTWTVSSAFQPSITGNEKGSWIVANASRIGPRSLRIEIEGVRTRACRIYVDNHGIKRYRARTRQEGDTDVPMAWTAYEVPAGQRIPLIMLWARSWGSRFEVELDFDAEWTIVGRVSCLWNDGPGGVRIPSLEEARGFLPEWVAISTASHGLVEATSRMVKRPRTPPPSNDEPRYLTVVHPYPLNANLKVLGDRRALALWLACCTGKDVLLAMFHKPTSPGMVIIEVDRDFDRFELLLGMHEWSKFLKGPRNEEEGKSSKVFWCKYNTGRLVEKNGWNRVYIEEHWFNGWSPKLTHLSSSDIRFPYPKTTWCDVPSEAMTGEPLCRPLPESKFPTPPPAPKAPVGSLQWISLKSGDSSPVTLSSSSSSRGSKKAVPSDSVSMTSSTRTSSSGSALSSRRPAPSPAPSSLTPHLRERLGAWSRQLPVATSRVPSTVGSRQRSDANSARGSAHPLTRPPGLPLPSGPTNKPSTGRYERFDWGDEYDEDEYDPSTANVSLYHEALSNHVPDPEGPIEPDQDYDYDEEDVPKRSTEDAMKDLFGSAPKAGRSACDRTHIGIQEGGNDNLWDGYVAPRKELPTKINKKGGEDWICPIHGSLCNPGICEKRGRLEMKRRLDQERQKRLEDKMKRQEKSEQNARRRLEKDSKREMSSDCSSSSETEGVDHDSRGRVEHSAEPSSLPESPESANGSEDDADDHWLWVGESDRLPKVNLMRRTSSVTNTHSDDDDELNVTSASTPRKAQTSTNVSRRDGSGANSWKQRGAAGFRPTVSAQSPTPGRTQSAWGARSSTCTEDSLATDERSIWGDAGVGTSQSPPLDRRQRMWDTRSTARVPTTPSSTRSERSTATNRTSTSRSSSAATSNQSENTIPSPTDLVVPPGGFPIYANEEWADPIAAAQKRRSSRRRHRKARGDDGSESGTQNTEQDSRSGSMAFDCQPKLPSVLDMDVELPPGGPGEHWGEPEVEW